jgi:hypothetical protein
VTASVHLRVEAEPAGSPALFSQRVSGDFFVTLRAGDIELGVVRVGTTLAWLHRDIGAAWRLDTTCRREGLPETVTVVAASSGARFGYLACRRLNHRQAMAVLEMATGAMERMAA